MKNKHEVTIKDRIYTLSPLTYSEWAGMYTNRFSLRNQSTVLKNHVHRVIKLDEDGLPLQDENGKPVRDRLPNVVDDATNPVLLRMLISKIYEISEFDLDRSELSNRTKMMHAYSTSYQGAIDTMVLLYMPTMYEKLYQSDVNNRLRILVAAEMVAGFSLEERFQEMEQIQAKNQLKGVMDPVNLDLRRRTRSDQKATQDQMENGTPGRAPTSVTEAANAAAEALRQQRQREIIGQQQRQFMTFNEHGVPDEAPLDGEDDFAVGGRPHQRIAHTPEDQRRLAHRQRIAKQNGLTLKQNPPTQ